MLYSSSIDSNLLLLQEVVTRCLAIYESASADSQQPMHLARWLLPPQDAVFMLKNEGFSSPVEDEGA